MTDDDVTFTYPAWEAEKDVPMVPLNDTYAVTQFIWERIVASKQAEKE